MSALSCRPFESIQIRYGDPSALDPKQARGRQRIDQGRSLGKHHRFAKALPRTDDTGQRRGRRQRARNDLDARFQVHPTVVGRHKGAGPQDNADRPGTGHGKPESSVTINRTDYKAQRCALMQKWASYLATLRKVGQF